jgi:hypothetical protein
VTTTKKKKRPRDRTAVPALRESTLFAQTIAESVNHSKKMNRPKSKVVDMRKVEDCGKAPSSVAVESREDPETGNLENQHKETGHSENQNTETGW